MIAGFFMPYVRGHAISPLARYVLVGYDDSLGKPTSYENNPYNVLPAGSKMRLIFNTRRPMVK
jgi:hypothetical protein